jgi:hypothetical protein
MRLNGQMTEAQSGLTASHESGQGWGSGLTKESPRSQSMRTPPKPRRAYACRLAKHNQFQTEGVLAVEYGNLWDSLISYFMLDVRCDPGRRHWALVEDQRCPI